MIEKTIKVAIIGGGIWGLSAAYHLARKGQEDVVVFERNTELAVETTKRAAGLVGQVRDSATMIQVTQYAIRLFQQMAEETDCDPGFIQSGSLMLAMNEQRMAAYQQNMAFVQQHGVEAMLVDEIEIQRLAPNIDPSCLTGALFIPTDGYLDPYRCAMAYANQAEKLGV
ncbi:MAG: FAD-dependent oxidoreductase, partial [Candidatus Poribacteria bacterium]|nr:FAD-dependent oxidoreductase [Candidatus Poribacteria bacterium]